MGMYISNSFWILVHFARKRSGLTVPLTLFMRLLVERSQLPDVSKIFSVTMVSLTTPLKIRLRNSKTNLTLRQREWLDTMFETASYKSMLQRLKNNIEDGVNT